jgi:hypothetical protein
VAACPTEALRYADTAAAPDAGSDRHRQGSGESAEAVAKAEAPAYIRQGLRQDVGRGFSPAVDANAGSDRLRQGPGESAEAVAKAEAPAIRSDTATAVRPFVPGFTDPAGCRPNLRFAAPAGSTRAARFDEIEERLRT